MTTHTTQTTDTSSMQKYSLIVISNEGLKKLDLKAIDWQYLLHLDSIENEVDFKNICKVIKEFSSLVSKP